MRYAAADAMIAARHSQQRRSAFAWWHVYSQYLHHHRAVVASFAARRLRSDGASAFALWRRWAHERALERRAIVCRWSRLLYTVRFSSVRVHMHWHDQRSFPWAFGTGQGDERQQAGLLLYML